LWKHFASRIVSRSYLPEWRCKPKLLRSALFWNITLALRGYSLLTFRNKISPFSKDQEKLLKMGSISCPVTSGMNYNHTLPNIPEERQSHLLYGGSLKSRKSAEFLLLSSLRISSLDIWQDFLYGGSARCRFTYAEKDRHKGRGDIYIYIYTYIYIYICMLGVEIETTVLRLEWLKTVFVLNTTPLS
jgi:hypothetical protein